MGPVVILYFTFRGTPPHQAFKVIPLGKAAERNRAKGQGEGDEGDWGQCETDT